MPQSHTPEVYPLSFMQEAMLFQCLQAQGSDMYVQQLSCELEGSLREADFADAWAQLIDRHAVLRTAFAWKDLPEPLQIAGRVRVPLDVLDWTGLAPDEQQTSLRELLANTRSGGFQMQKAPLHKLQLIRLAANRCQMVWTWHHILLDPWSVSVIFREFFALYDGQSLPPAPAFRDFIAWQRSRDSAKAEEYWRKYLDGVTRATPLGLDRGFTGNTGYLLKHESLSAEEAQAIQSAAAALKVSAFTILQGAWALLLSRYSGTEEALFGTAVSGRPAELPHIEDMSGLLINTIPVRCHIENEEAVRDWLPRLQRQQHETQPFDYVPLHRIQAWSGVPAGSPLLESLLVLENVPMQAETFASRDLRMGQSSLSERTEFPLTVMMSLGREPKLSIGLERSRFFDEDAVLILRQLRFVLHQLVEQAEVSVRQIDIFTPAERLDFISSGRPERSLSLQPVAALFDQQVQRTAHVMAAIYRSESGHEFTWTYEQLQQRSQQYSHGLLRSGLKRGDRVAVCADASLDRLAAILGILRAGGVYLPLDPEMPSALLRDLVEDAEPALIFATADLSAGFAQSEDSRTLLLEGAFREVEPLCDEVEVSPQDIAYLIYTSGSTGRRKAVAVTHASLQSLVETQIAAFRIEPQSRVLQFSSLSFDASISEIFTALLAGAALYTAPRRLLLPSREFLALLGAWQITTATLPPSVLAALPYTDLPDLQTLISAGEACRSELVERWSNGRLFLNAYGPTECTVCATMGEARRGVVSPPIGRPCDDVQVYLLDDALEPVPSGAVGNMYLGGRQVSCGYWNRPELTASAFLPDLFSPHPGARMYRTGDLARLLPTGELAYLGRSDEQVKIRGIRIEPGEVVSAILRDSCISEAAVIAADDSGEGAALTAYVVPKNGAGETGWWPSLAEYLIYDDFAYHAMTSDERRNESYRAAIRQHVPGKVVLEVGTGPEALLARFCIEAGASRVYAVELLEETFRQAQRRVRELGLEDRILLVHGDATKVTLPEPCTVCVSEIVGALGGCEGAAVILNSARRLLTSDAIMIPIRSRTLIAPVELPESLRGRLGFGELPARYVERIFADAGGAFDLRLAAKGFRYSSLLAEPRMLEDLDFRSVTPASGSYDADFTIHRPGQMDGFVAWLMLETGAGEEIDILAHDHCWLPVFFPLPAGSVAVKSGDDIVAKAGFNLNHDGLHPDYFVHGEIASSDGTVTAFHYEAPHDPKIFKGTAFTRHFFEESNVPRIETASFQPVLLQQRLRRSLPAYMVPELFVVLETLPRTLSGKLDRKALPKPVSQPPLAETRPSTVPRNKTEQEIVSIWREVLRQDEIDLQTSFFQHGGRSLLLLRVQTEIERRLGIEVSTTELFRYPTVETLAQYLHENTSSQVPAPDRSASAEKRVSARREVIALKSVIKERLKTPLKSVLKDPLKTAFHPTTLASAPEPEDGA
jgi:amino acid adenylation domain-containing protein